MTAERIRVAGFVLSQACSKLSRLAKDSHTASANRFFLDTIDSINRRLIRPCLDRDRRRRLPFSYFPLETRRAQL